jgi:alanyl-tRNA synthetase
MTGNQVRATFLKFFESKGHKIVPSASLIPENDPTVLFTTAGMHPLVPYLMGEAHPEGQRLADAQKCVRTGDIDEVGDNRHLTFFEMLGNWSLGDYFKKEAIAWSFELLTGPNGYGLDPSRLYVSVFEGDADAPRDDESIRIWTEQFATRGIEAIVGERIFTYPKSKNWWGPAGLTGPCGPDTEMFYDTLALAEAGQHAPKWLGEGSCHPNCDCGRYVEIWNDVFMEYEKKADGSFVPLAQKNVDTGMGLERMAMMLQNEPTVFETDLFTPIIAAIERRSGRTYEPDGPGFARIGAIISGESSAVDEAHAATVRAMRIVADHVKTATFIIGDPRGVGPSNTDQGYIVRRLIRRAVRFGRQLGIDGVFTPEVAEAVIALYREQYPELESRAAVITTALRDEEEKFSATLERGLKEAMKLQEQFASMSEIPGESAFYLYESFGFPKELTEEVLGKTVVAHEWDVAMKAHQDKSRAGAEQKFSGGLADHSEIVVRMHTATHLLHKALRNVLGEHVEQKGSNITHERLRFDFSHGAKMTPDEIKRVEDMVNEQIQKDLPVRFEMYTVDEAKAAGAIGLFEDKYAALGNKVKVYMVGDDARGYYSKEICGGPHVEHTALVGTFKIAKEEASSAGVRRIKATVA